MHPAAICASPVKDQNMFNIKRGALSLALLAGASLAVAAPASAAGVGIHIGGAGLGVTVGSGHYYDEHHHRQAYSYPSDWRAYHHRQSWYRSHRSWNDESNADYYRH
jgi:hypothetical protein